MTLEQIDLTGRDFIVVGGAGYIGSHVCKTIHTHGGRAITFDNLSSGHKRAVKWGPLEQVDVRHAAPLDTAFAKYPNAKAVIHLASSIEVGIGETHPAEFYDNNVTGALVLLGAMRRAKISHMIFSSTCATYGETENMPLLETQIQNPISTYGKTKLAIEHMIQSFHNAYGLGYVTLRYFNAAGADASGEIGEEHDPETHIIPIAIASVLGQRGQMKIFGTDYDTSDGTCVRDYIHVTDIALAHIQAIDAFDKGLASAEINIGTGTGVSNLEILKAIEHISGRSIDYEKAPRRSGDLARLYADPTKAQKILGFSPEHSSIDNIIKTAWNFHSKGLR